MPNNPYLPPLVDQDVVISRHLCVPLSVPWKILGVMERMLTKYAPLEHVCRVPLTSPIFCPSWLLTGGVENSRDPQGNHPPLLTSHLPKMLQRVARVQNCGPTPCDNFLARRAAIHGVGVLVQSTFLDCVTENVRSLP